MRHIFLATVLLIFMSGCFDNPIKPAPEVSEDIVNIVGCAIRNDVDCVTEIVETYYPEPDEVLPEVVETDPQTKVTYLTFRKGSQPSPNIHGLAPRNNYLEWSDTRFQVWANGDNTTLRGTPLEIVGITFKRGISANPRSRIVYSLQDRYNRFEAWVGIPDYQDGDINHIPCGHGGSVQFFF